MEMFLVPGTGFKKLALVRNQGSDWHWSEKGGLLIIHSTTTFASCSIHVLYEPFQNPGLGNLKLSCKG